MVQTHYIGLLGPFPKSLTSLLAYDTTEITSGGCISLTGKQSLDDIV